MRNRVRRPHVPCSGVALPELEVVVVHHRTPALLARTLESLATHRPDVPVLVVDTALDATLPRQLDGAHPSDLGYWRMAEALEPVLRAALGG